MQFVCSDDLRVSLVFIRVLNVSYQPTILITIFLQVLSHYLLASLPVLNEARRSVLSLSPSLDFVPQKTKLGYWKIDLLLYFQDQANEVLTSIDASFVHFDIVSWMRFLL